MDKPQERKEKMKEWLKDKHNLSFIFILGLGVLLRFYFFSITKTQPLWWDEADYLAYAKNLAGLGVDWIVTAKHNSLVPYLASIIFKIGFGEIAVKILLILIPSILSIVLVYLISIEMYKDKRIGLIASFLMAVSWPHLFNSTRFHVDVPGLFVGLLAIYIFWRGYENKEKIFGKIDAKWSIPLTIILVFLTYSIRRGYFLFGLFFFSYIISTRKIKDLTKDKYNWIGAALGMGVFLLVENLIFISKITNVGESYFHDELPINFLAFDIFESYFKVAGNLDPLFYLFWVGLILLTINLFLGFGYIKNEKSLKIRADVFNLITIALTLLFFIYILRVPESFGEPRWYFPLLFASFICISKAGLFVGDKIKRYNKEISIGILILLIGFGGYYQYNYADDLIKNKINSYEGIKAASLMIKSVSNPEDKILTMGQPQVEYYSERRTEHASRWVGIDASNSSLHFESTLNKLMEDQEVRFILISFSEPGYPQWMKRVSSNSWQIPFMDSKIDFSTGQQDIKRETTYDEITFKLLSVENEVFIYEVIRK